MANMEGASYMKAGEGGMVEGEEDVKSEHLVLKTS